MYKNFCLVFLFFAKHKNAYILKTVLDRADCADFGCHNSIRLEMKHFLNTLALTFISFSGRFVFAMQKHYLFFFASDPLVILSFCMSRLCLMNVLTFYKIQLLSESKPND